MTTTTPAEHADKQQKIAAADLGNALAVTAKYTDTPTLPADIQNAGWACRLLLVGALTDSALSSTAARQMVRVHLRELMHDDSKPRGVAGVYRHCLAGLDGRERG